MNRTTNYNLCQFEETDRVRRTDFNEDNAKIDGALGALAARLSTRGNCRVVTGQYTGTGTFGEGNAKVFAFDKPIALLGVATSYGIIFTAPGCDGAFCLCKGMSTLYSATWDGRKRVVFSSTVSASSQLNQLGMSYSYFALLEE